VTPVERAGYEHGIRYHAPRRREPGPVLGVAASLLILLVAGQVSLASMLEQGVDESVAAPAATATTSATAMTSPSVAALPTATAPPSTTDGPPAPAVTGAAVVELTYGSGADTPDPGAGDLLDEVADELLDDPAAVVRVVGHAEPSNDPDLEKQLSLERALRVVDLLGRRGVPPARVQVVAAGATEAEAPGDGALVNSRVTLEITSG